MDSQDYPVRHFELMKELATALKALPALILQHNYTNEAFGSWSLNIRYARQPLRVLFDGRDGIVQLEDLSSKEAQNGWDKTLWQIDCTSPDSFPLKAVIDAIQATGKDRR